MSRHVRVLACAIATVSLPKDARGDAAASAPLVGMFEALQRPAVSAVVEAPTELRVGRAEIRPASGSKLLVLSALGRRCGVVLDGPASLSYRVEDRFSTMLAERNLKRASGVKSTRTGDQLLASGVLKGFAIFGWDIDVPETPASAPPPAAPPAWLLEWLAEKRGANPARDMLVTAWNSDAGYRWAALRGVDDHFELDVDPRSSVRQEGLSRQYELPAGAAAGEARRVTETLVSQPTSGAWWEAPARDFVSIDTDLRLVDNGGDRLRLTASILVKSLRDKLRLLDLVLTREFRNAFGERREYTISSLTVDGQSVPYVHHLQGDLLVELKAPLAARQDARLEVAVDGELLGRPAGDNYWRLGLSAWYPKPGGTGEEWSQFRIDAQTRSPFTPIPAGQVVRSETNAGLARVVTTLPGPMQGAVVVAGKYSTVTEEHQGRRVHVSTYAWSREEEARRLARNVLSICQCLESWLGVPYPFQDLKLIEMTSWGWGQAPPGVIFITKEAFLSRARARIDEETEMMATLTSRGVNERIAHEVAHGWFPHVAKVVRIEENWLSESFADYASAVCLERTMADKGRAKFFWERQLGDWKQYAKRAGEGASVFFAAHLTDRERDQDAWYYLLYGKGPLVLHALRGELARGAGGTEEGDRLFFTWIRSYVKNFTFKPGETRHLVAILDKITGKEWQPWFERYVYGDETPALR